MKLVVGIGNPGPAYAGTRHNVGFLVVDEVADRLGLAFESAPGPVACARGERAGHPFRLIKPMSYMNRSGEALLGHLGGVLPDPGEALVVMDDLALPLGAIRLRSRGSSGGHHGLQSLLEAFGTDAVPRLRLGIGTVAAEEWREHVLSRFEASEEEVLRGALKAAADGVLGFLDGRDFARLQQETQRASPSAEP